MSLVAGLLLSGVVAARQQAPSPRVPAPGAQTQPPPRTQPGQPQPPPAQQPPAQQPPAQQPPPPQPQQPVFRAGINFVRVDVIVTDDKGNPVTNLDQKDFEVLEDGVPQTVQTFRLVDIPNTPPPDAEPPHEIRNEYDQEREATRPDVRLFVIMLDDYHVRRGASMRVKEPLIRFVQQDLSPLDLVAVMYPLTPLDALQFTHNRDSIVSAINAFVGRKYDYTPRNEFEEQYAYYPAATVERIRNQVSLSALKGLTTWLGSVREGRKAVILVSEGYTNNLPPQLNDPIAAIPGLGNPSQPGAQNTDPRAESVHFFETADMMTDLREVYDAANRANTAIYALDPRGLAAFEYDINEGVASQADRTALSDTLDTLHVLADETDGRAIVNSNDLDRGLRQIVRDSSAYYLLGYTSSVAPADGKFHEIKVRVKRPGLEVRARKGYWAYTAEDVARATAPATPGPAPDVEEALASVSSSPRGRAARTWVGTARGADGKTRVTYVWEPMPPRPGQSNPLPAPVKADVLASSADGGLVYRGTVVPPSGETAGVRPPAAVTFDAEPGPLQLRVSFEVADGGVVDSERRDVPVPDFTNPEVMLATPEVLRAFTPRQMREIKADPRATPTSTREFSRRDRLLIRFEAYGPGGAAPTVTTKLLNRQGQPMFDLTAEPPSATVHAYQVEVPLASVPPGEYLFEAAAAGADGKSVRQLVGLRITG